MVWDFHSMVSWNWCGAHIFTTLEWGTLKVCQFNELDDLIGTQKWVTEVHTPISSLGIISCSLLSQYIHIKNYIGLLKY